MKIQKTAIARATGRLRSSRDVHFVANRAAHLLKISVLAKPRSNKSQKIQTKTKQILQTIINTKTAIARATGRPRSSRDVHFVANRAAHLFKISVLAKLRANKSEKSKKTNVF